MYSCNEKGRKTMSLSYEPLWQMLSEKNITKMEFAKMIGISNATLAKIGKNEPITLTTVDKICNCFNCEIENVVKHIQDIRIIPHNFIVNLGIIVLANEITEIEGEHYRFRKRPYVILSVAHSNENTDSKNIVIPSHEDLMYNVAPIYKTSSHIFHPSRIFFNDIDIDGKLTTGYVSLKNISIMSSRKFEKKLGIMPEYYMKEIDKVLQTLDN